MRGRPFRFVDLLSRILARGWEKRSPGAHKATARGTGESAGATGAAAAGTDPTVHAPRATSAAEGAGAGSTSSSARSSAAHRAAPSGAARPEAPRATSIRRSSEGRLPPSRRINKPRRGERELTVPLTLERVERMVTSTMGYGLHRHEEDGHVCLLGTWDGFPFVLEIPEGHEGWLLVSGDWEEPAREGQRSELAASINDWNRDKIYPTVAIVDTPVGALVRATYLADLRAGATDSQLRLHLDTALSSATHALAQIRPLLPEL